MSKLDGRYSLGDYTLVFNVNTLCDLEEALGVGDLNELMTVFNSLSDKPSIRTIRSLFYGALKQEHAEMTPGIAGAIISDVGLECATDALMKALEMAFPDGDGDSAEGNVKDPPAPRRKSGGGKKP